MIGVCETGIVLGLTAAWDRKQGILNDQLMSNICGILSGLVGKTIAFVCDDACQLSIQL